MSALPKVIKKDLNYKFSSNQIQLKDTSDVHYFKLPYSDNLSHRIKNNLSRLGKEFCKESVNIKLVFTSFKIKNYFSYKDLTPDDFKSFLVYKFTSASCSSGYIGETCRHWLRIEKHIKRDNKSHVFKHLHFTAAFFGSYNSLSFKIIDKANSKFDLKIKEALNINWRKPNLNAQQNYLSFTLSLWLPSPLICFFFLFCFVFLGFFSVSLSSIIFIIFDTNYWHLLLS